MAGQSVSTPSKGRSKSHPSLSSRNRPKCGPFSSNLQSVLPEDLFKLPENRFTPVLKPLCYVPFTLISLLHNFFISYILPSTTRHTVEATTDAMLVLGFLIFTFPVDILCVVTRVWLFARYFPSVYGSGKTTCDDNAMVEWVAKASSKVPLLGTVARKIPYFRERLPQPEDVDPTDPKYGYKECAGEIYNDPRIRFWGPEGTYTQYPNQINLDSTNGNVLQCSCLSSPSRDKSTASLTLTSPTDRSTTPFSRRHAHSLPSKASTQASSVSFVPQTGRKMSSDSSRSRSECTESSDCFSRGSSGRSSLSSACPGQVTFDADSVLVESCSEGESSQQALPKQSPKTKVFNVKRRLISTPPSVTHTKGP